MAIRSLATPTPISTDARVDVVVTSDDAIWRENGGRQLEAIEQAGRALLAAQEAAEREPSDIATADLAARRAAFEEAQAALGAALGKLELYRATSDVSVLTVPDDATWWTLRPLDKGETGEAHKAAGEPSVLGMHLQTELIERATEAVNKRHPGWLAPEERERLLARERARAIDALKAQDREHGSKDAEALDAFVGWRNRLRVETLRRALVEIRNGPPDTPVEVFVEQFGRILEARPFDRLGVELGDHAIRVAGGLAPVGKAGSSSSSGETTTSPTSGPASSAESSPASAASEAIAEARSA